jgi:hypothetical protein
VVENEEGNEWQERKAELKGMFTKTTLFPLAWLSNGSGRGFVFITQYITQVQMCCDFRFS